MNGRLVLACAAALLAAACSGPMPPVSGDTARTDATDVPVGPMDGEIAADAQRCTGNAECSNNVYCDGEERCVGGVCMPGRDPCDDGRSCTMDSCDEAMRMCTNAPDDAMCGDMNACNGTERCNPSAPGALPTGCEPVRPDNVIDCDDSNTCTIDSCDSTGGCVHAPRDLDGDGFVDRACTLDGTPVGPPGTDCNDGDVSVYPGAPEVCNDSRDNNCDGRTDFADSSCLPSNDTCATATVLPGPGTYSGSTVGLRRDFTVTCGSASDGGDAVFEFTTTAPQDVTATISGGTSESNTTVTLVSSCSPYMEMRCARGSFGTAPSMRYRGLPAGTYRLIVSAGSAGSPFRLNLRYDPPSPPTPNYTLMASPAGVAWIDICAMGGTRVLPSVDDAQAAIPRTSVPFPLRVYGVAVMTDLTVSSNGWLSMNSGTSGALSGMVPAPDAPNLTIAPLWTDQLTGPEGVCFGMTGTAPNRKFVVQWANNRDFGGTGTMFRYEVIINEQASATGNNIIDVVYNSLVSPSRTYSAGIENEDGTVGTNIPPPFTAPRIVRLMPSL